MNEIKITLLNEDECKNFFKLWGLTSAVCYATPDEYATGVGKSCLSTKHFSGGRHRYIVLKFENISRACYDEETDILTSAGWKNFKDIKEDEVVATLNPDTGCVEYHKINEKISYNYTGNMHLIQNSAVDLNITANHNVFFKKQDSVYKHNNHTNYLIPIESVKTSKIIMDKRFNVDNMVSDTITIKGYSYNKKTNNGSYKEMYTGDLTLNRADYYKLLAWYLSEGSTYYDKKECKYVISIYQTKSSDNIKNNTIEEIMDIVGRLGFTPNYSKNRVRFNSRTLGKFFKELGTSGNKYIPYIISESFNKEYARIFLNEYFKGDGHIDKNGVGFLYTSSNVLADQLQELCFIAGWTGLKRERNRDKIGTKHIIEDREVTINLPSYVINVSFGVRNSQPNINLKKHMTIEPVKDKPVYCVNVTNNIIFVRRNGRAIWCGNCADQMARHSVGTAINMQSGRYVNLANFTYHTPTPIKNNIKAKGIYENLMNTIEKAYVEICEALEEDGLRGEKVYECARGIAPMNHHTKLVMGFTVEALTNFLNKRLCVCSQEEIQQVARMVKKIVGNELPELKPLLVPICQAQLWCPESPKRTCGAFMQKSEVEKILLQHKKTILEKNRQTV